MTSPSSISKNEEGAREVINNAFRIIRAQAPQVADTVNSEVNIVWDEEEERAYVDNDGMLNVSLGMLMLKSPEYVAFAITHIALLRDAKSRERMGNRSDTLAWNVAVSQEAFAKQEAMGMQRPAEAEGTIAFPDLFDKKAEEIYDECVKRTAYITRTTPEVAVDEKEPAPTPQR
jgi:hypothetical protein